MKLNFTQYLGPPMSVFGLIDSSTDELPYAHTLIKIKESKKKPPDTKAKRRKSTKGTKQPKSKKKKSNDETVQNDDDEPASEKEDQEVEEEDEEVKMESSEEESNKENSNMIADVDLNKFSIYFREFDLSIINFVNLELDLAATDEMPSSASFSSIDITTTKCKLKPHLLNAILMDFNQKASQVFKLASGKSFGGGPAGASAGPQASKVTKSQLFAQLNAVDAKALARHLVDNCLDSLFNHMDAVNKHIRSIQAKYDDMKDPNEICNNSGNICLLKCLNQIIKLLNTFFTWLNSNNEAALLAEVIKKLTLKMNESSAGNANQEVMLTTQIDKVPELYFYNYVARLKDVILDLNTMNDLIKLLDLLCNKVIVNKRNGMLKQFEKKFRLILTAVCLYFIILYLKTRCQT
jgi:hypothetical protein